MMEEKNKDEKWLKEQLGEMDAEAAKKYRLLQAGRLLDGHIDECKKKGHKVPIRVYTKLDALLSFSDGRLNLGDRIFFDDEQGLPTKPKVAIVSKIVSKGDVDSELILRIVPDDDDDKKSEVQ